MGRIMSRQFFRNSSANESEILAVPQLRPAEPAEPPPPRSEIERGFMTMLANHDRERANVLMSKNESLVN